MKFTFETTVIVYWGKIVQASLLGNDHKNVKRTLKMLLLELCGVCSFVACHLMASYKIYNENKTTVDSKIFTFVCRTYMKKSHPCPD